MGGRGSSSATSRAGIKSGAQENNTFTIDVNADFQKIETGMKPDEALKIAEEQIRDLDYEMAVLIAKDGTAYIAKGDNGSVRPPYQELKDDGYDTSETIGLHNHPLVGKRTFGGPSSDADWNSMFRNNLASSHITAVEGRYILKITDPSKINKAMDFFTLQKKNGYYWQRKKQSNYRVNADKEFNRGGYENNIDNYLKACMVTLRKFGPRYGFELEFQPNQGYEHLYD